MYPNIRNLLPHERAAISRAAAQVDGACERPWIAAMKDLPEDIVKVRAGFYRVGALVIQKGAKWCVYQETGFLPKERFDTLQEAAWWAHHNQPKGKA